MPFSSAVIPERAWFADRLKYTLDSLSIWYRSVQLMSLLLRAYNLSVNTYFPRRYIIHPNSPEPDHMPTIDELRTYLASIGINPPDFLLEGWLEAITEMQVCLTEHYNPGVAKLIALYALGLYGVASGDRYITSQSAPSGASQSYKYASLSDRWRMQMSLLRQFDKYGCAAPFLPADPTANTIMAIVGRPNSRRGCC